MANSKISALTSASTPLAGTEVLPIVQSSTTKQVSVANLTSGRDVATAALTSTKTSSGALVDVATIQNSSGATNTEVGLFFAPTTATGNIRGARISAYQVTGNNDIGLRFYTGNGATIAVAQTISPTSDITFNLGNFVQGTAAKGINFTANTGAAGKTSQLLNWYEEGTWTPAIASGGGTITASTTAGYYTRIGRQVTFNCYVSVSSVSSPTGDVTISGLPFTSFNNANNVQSFSVYSDGLTAGATTSLVSTMGGNATTFIVRVWSAGGAGYAAPYVQAGAYFRISGSYFA